jgi:hypothetical protein
MGFQLVGVDDAKDGSEPQDLGDDKRLTLLNGVITERRGQVSAQCLLAQLAAERIITTSETGVSLARLPRHALTIFIGTQ